jgi:ATPase components of various ABC-type transport systems, contain duplicated ATPase
MTENTAPDEPTLAIDDLVVRFHTESGEVDAVRGVSLEVLPGETLALVGESGSGKSTVALAALGLLPPNAAMSGSVSITGTDIVSASDGVLRRLRGRTAGMVFQEPATALDPLTRIGAQIAEVITNHRKVPAAEARSEAVELLRRVGVPDPENRVSAFPFQLSGGQRQRVVIAMAIANRPQLLIADEPTTALDVTVQAEILDLLRALAAEERMGVLLVTHNMGVVADFADRVAVMHHGRIVETGAVERVLLEPEDDYSKHLLAAVPRLDVAERQADATASYLDGDVVLELRDVDVVFGPRRQSVHALDRVSMLVRQGENLGVVGESGSGKSTAARVALGLIRPDAGEVRLFGTQLRGTHGRARRELRSKIGVVLQDPVASLDARMSVAEVVAEPLRVHRKRLSSHERRRLAVQALDAVRLPAALADRAPRELSGGQRQRVSLARALVLGPRLLIADEPTSALDVSVQKSVLEVITEMQSELGFACLFVSHDLAVVQSFCSRVVVMESGRIVEEGRTDRTLVSPVDDYTKRLLRAVPVPDPLVQRRRRAERVAQTSDDLIPVE